MINKIIQWNIRGAKTNINKLIIPTSIYTPTILCLQETHLKEKKHSQHKTLLILQFHQTNRASRGSSILINNTILHCEIVVVKKKPKILST